nr:hypothetical protein [Nonomuraea polychroma]
MTKGGGIAVRDVTSVEGGVRGHVWFDAVHAHRAPSVRIRVEGDHVPACGPDHEIVRLQRERDGFAVTGVVHANEVLPVDRAANGADDLGVDRWRGELPVVAG